MSDLISRQAAIDYLMTNMAWYNEDGYEESEGEKMSAITDLINGVPSAQSERDAIQIDWIKDWFAKELDLKAFEEFLEPPYDPSVYVQSILEQMVKDWGKGK